MADSPNNKEIMRFELDVTDVEAKAKRIDDLLGKIGRGRAAGQDVSEFTTQLESELNALDKSRGKTAEADSAIKQLSRSKRDLADVVNLLGGRFGGLIGDVDGVVQVLMGGSGLVKGVAAALAAITTLTIAFKTHTDAVKAAREEHEKFQAIRHGQDKAGVALRGQVAEELRAAGVDAGQAGPVADRMRQLMVEQNVPRDVALKVAAAEAFMAGRGTPLNGEDAGALLAGVTNTPGFSLGGGSVEANAAVRNAITLGRKPGVADAAKSFFAQKAAETAQQVPTIAEAAAARGGVDIAGLGEYLMRTRPDLTPRVRDAILRLAGGASEDNVLYSDENISGIPMPRFHPSEQASIRATAGMLRTMAEGVAPGDPGPQRPNITIGTVNSVGNRNTSPMYTPAATGPASGAVAR